MVGSGIMVLWEGALVFFVLQLYCLTENQGIFSSSILTTLFFMAPALFRVQGAGLPAVQCL